MCSFIPVRSTLRVPQVSDLRPQYTAVNLLSSSAQVSIVPVATNKVHIQIVLVNRDRHNCLASRMPLFVQQIPSDLARDNGAYCLFPSKFFVMTTTCSTTKITGAYESVHGDGLFVS
jgi:hypothetical protein